MKQKIIIGVIAVIAVALFIYGNKRTEWYQATNGYGPLNVIEEGITTNNTSGSFLIDDVKDIYVIVKLHQKSGNVNITTDINNEIIMQEASTSNNEYKSDVYKNVKGQCSVFLEISDDAEGDYIYEIYTREKNYRRWIRRIKELF